MMLSKTYSMAESNYIHYMLLPFAIFQDAEYVPSSL